MESLAKNKNCTCLFLLFHHCYVYKNMKCLRSLKNESSLKSYFQIPCVFPVCSLSNRTFSLRQFQKLAIISYPKPALKNSKILWQIAQYLLFLESGNLERKQTKLSWQNFPKREFFLFSLCSTPYRLWPYLTCQLIYIININCSSHQLTYIMPANHLLLTKRLKPP